MQDLLGRGPFADFDQDTMSMMVDEAERFSREVLAPLNEASDRIGARFEDGVVTTPPGFKQAFKAYAESGWISLAGDPQYGGMGAPVMLEAATGELFEVGCLAFNLTRLLTSGAANLIRSFGTAEQKQKYMSRMYSGEWAGTMCLTEAGAGTDVGASRTTAVPEGDHYLIEGEKIFITSGDHDLASNIVHAVLARTPDAAKGTRGLSLFIVPKFRSDEAGNLGEANGVKALRIEEKMGIHGSPTCVMGYGQDAPCHGYLLGELGGGMRQMFQMMNEARLMVGMEGAAIGNAAYLQAREYSAERIQGGDATRRKSGRVAIIEHPDVRRMLLWQKAHAEGVRALGYYTAMLVDRAHVESAEGNAEAAAATSAMASVLTPIIKAYGSDIGFLVADSALQCHGGYGYTNEYPAEQFVRDVRISRIYEGANGIQALDLVGRKLGLHGGADARACLDAFSAMAEEARQVGLNEVADAVDAALSAVAEVAMGFATASNPVQPLLSAYGFLELMGEASVGALLAQQAALATTALSGIAASRGLPAGDDKALQELAQDDEETAFYWGKVMNARFFAAQVLSLSPARAARALKADTSAMDIVF
jgi:alkylation response protein AidB-like acyl-CoA dehydrogenase